MTTLKEAGVDINQNYATDIKQDLQDFLKDHENITDTKNVISSTKEALQPIFNDVISWPDLAEKMETTVNMEHLKSLLTVIAWEFKNDNSNYLDMYSTRKKTLVFALQSALMIMWYPLGTDLVDGRYGVATKNAVAQFQTKKWLVNIDWAAWYETFQALASISDFTIEKISEEDKNIVPVYKKKVKKDTITHIQGVTNDLETIWYEWLKANGTFFDSNNTDCNWNENPSDKELKHFLAPSIDKVPNPVKDGTVVEVDVGVYKYYFFPWNRNVYQTTMWWRELVSKWKRDQLSKNGTWVEQEVATLSAFKNQINKVAWWMSAILKKYWYEEYSINIKDNGSKKNFDVSLSKTTTITNQSTFLWGGVSTSSSTDTINLWKLSSNDFANGDIFNTSW
jgi:hypothetical protein